MKTKPTKEEFLKNVIKEIENIKEKATYEEKENLDFSNFEFDNASKCIYGQMTGDCDSARAVELTPKKHSDIILGQGFKSQEFGGTSEKYFTDLEMYLFISNDKTHEKIINYIKGFSETLDIPLPN